MAQRAAADDATTRRSPRFRTGLLWTLLVVCVASAVTIAFLAATRPVAALGIQGQQAGIQAQRERVMSQAEQFMIRINTYGPQYLDGDQMPKYRQLVEQVITPKFDADFEKNVPVAEATVKQAGVARTAQVYNAGVVSIDSDSATALVAGSFTQSYPETAGSQSRVETDPSPFRVSVKLVKIKGQWLVDDFTPVVDANDDSGTSGSSGSSGVPSVVPSTQPSTSPSGGSGTGGSGTGRSGTGSGAATPSTGASR